MKIFQSSSFWFFCFTAIAFLTLNVGSGGQDISLSFLNLPAWFLYLVALQIILTLAMLIFTLQFWKTEEND